MDSLGRRHRWWRRRRKGAVNDGRRQISWRWSGFHSRTMAGDGVPIDRRSAIRHQTPSCHQSPPVHHRSSTRHPPSVKIYRNKLAARPPPALPRILVRPPP
ncbi:latrophilin-3 [Striga asiatica]|uniref:Latrophilin-3 n=1 Tax=Striga asiatica TaxID=4170 RepID=A0A5A7QC68_STRAF|nr:latrophilin-3 [Striga asiatica]